ncbi:MAG TPA: DNA recombination protein RmuC, partial [Bacteroidota bacterium]
IILLSVVLVALAAVIWILLRKPGPAQDGMQTVSFLQQQMDSLRSELALSLKNTTDSVNKHLEIVTSQTGQVGQRLDNAAKVIQDVQGKLGELGRATQEIKELGLNVSKLEGLLRAPKLRGGLGELLLEDLLKQVLPANSYAIQYRFKTGESVDAMILTAGGKVPVDSKFPLENFRKMIDATADQEKRVAQRTFVSDVKKHIDSIAAKYIRPDEGTFDFALMYIPAENIYYETIIREDSFGEEHGLYSYATQKHVVPVSPNSFYAHLRVIALGLKGLEIEKSAKEIFQNLHRLGAELQKFTEVFETLGTHLNNAKNNYDKADKQLSTFADRMKGLQTPEKEEKEDSTQLDLLSGNK